MVQIGDKLIHFGSSQHENYTIHKNNERKRLYILRHSKNENWNDIFSPGFWSRWLLWNKPTLRESIKDIERNFGVKIKMNIGIV
jgi:hypothetical protein